MKRTTHWLVAGMISLGAAAVNADVIVQDQFDANITDDAGDPLDVAWTLAGNAGVAGHALDGANGVLDFSGSDGFDAVLAGFTPFTMTNAGDSISYSARVRHNVAAVVNSGFRIALVNTNGTNPDATTNDTFGYTLILNLGDGTGGGIAEATNTTLGTGALPSGNNTLDLGGGNVWHTINATIKYLGGNNYELTAGLDGVTKINAVPYTDANPTLTFDRIVFGLGGSGAGSGFQLDDVAVTTLVPEPSVLSAGLILGAGSLMVRRQR